LTQCRSAFRLPVELCNYALSQSSTNNKKGNKPMNGFLAYIMPVATNGAPSHPIVLPPEGAPPGIWPSPGHPAHPIAPGGPPPVAGWTPPGTRPEHPIAPGGGVGIWPSPGVPTHPIYIPITPPPDSGLKPEHPIYIPVYPSHPIYPGEGITDEVKQQIKEFLTGNLPPATGPHAAKK
jgi:hypothetical protein